MTRHTACLSLCVQNREPLMPSPQFIKSYFSSFTDDIISQPLQKGEKKDEDKDKEGEAAEVSERSELGHLPLLVYTIQSADIVDD